MNFFDDKNNWRNEGLPDPTNWIVQHSATRGTLNVYDKDTRNAQDIDVMTFFPVAERYMITGKTGSGRKIQSPMFLNNKSSVPVYSYPANGQGDRELLGEFSWKNKGDKSAIKDRGGRYCVRVYGIAVHETMGVRFVRLDITGFALSAYYNQRGDIDTQLIDVTGKGGKIEDRDGNMVAKLDNPYKEGQELVFPLFRNCQDHPTVPADKLEKLKAHATTIMAYLDQKTYDYEEQKPENNSSGGDEVVTSSAPEAEAPPVDGDDLPW